MLTVKTYTRDAMGATVLLVVFWIIALFSEAVLFSMALATIPCILGILGRSKVIQMHSKGCVVRILFWKRFYPWDAFQTIRLLDFSRAPGAKNSHTFCEGILFSTKKIRKYPCKIDPETYLALHDPFCRKGFYIQFPPKETFSAKWLGVPVSSLYLYPVRREEFMSEVNEWGLKIEGLNVPMPPEQLAAKKKR